MAASAARVPATAAGLTERAADDRVEPVASETSPLRRTPNSSIGSSSGILHPADDGELEIVDIQAPPRRPAQEATDVIEYINDEDEEGGEEEEQPAFLRHPSELTLIASSSNDSNVDEKWPDRIIFNSPDTYRFSDGQVGMSERVSRVQYREDGKDSEKTTNFSTATQLDRSVSKWTTSTTSSSGRGYEIVKHSNNSLILLITVFCASIPIVLGAFFYASLGLKASTGRREGRYLVRAADDAPSIHIGTELLNPLLISSVISTVISSTAPLILGLAAYHYGHEWVKASGLNTTGRNRNLLTPYQHSLLLTMTTSASEWSFFSFWRYTLTRTPKRKDSLRRRTRAALPPMLIKGAVALGIILVLTYAVKAIDIVLHDTIKNGIIDFTRPANIPGSFVLKKECHNETSPGCPITGRSNEGFQAAANLSSLFRAYPMGNLSEQHANVAIMAAPPSTEVGQMYTASTYAIASTCYAFRPVCYVANETVIGCTALNASDSDSYWATVQDEALNPNVQLFLKPHDGEGARRGPSVGGTATLRNPVELLGWSCFPNYANIYYDDFHRNTTFVNWWMIGQGIDPAVVLCSLLACNTTLYRAQYTFNNGSLSVNPTSFILADNSSVLTFSDVLPFNTYYQDINGTRFLDSMIYKYTEKFIDAQFQTAVTSAGNSVGNDTVLYQNALAQSLSNLLISWSAGAIETGPSLTSQVTETVLSVQIPLSWSYLYIFCLFFYAFLIIVLGLSCFTIPVKHALTDKVIVKDGVRYRIAVPQHGIARMRFTDVSTIVHELVPQDGHASRLDPQDMFDEVGGSDGSSSAGGGIRRADTSLSSPSEQDGSVSITTGLRRKKSRAEKELKTVLVENKATGELHLKVEAR